MHDRTDADRRRRRSIRTDAVDARSRVSTGHTPRGRRRSTLRLSRTHVSGRTHGIPSTPKSCFYFRATLTHGTLQIPKSLRALTDIREPNFHFRAPNNEQFPSRRFERRTWNKCGNRHTGKIIFVLGAKIFGTYDSAGTLPCFQLRQVHASLRRRAKHKQQ